MVYGITKNSDQDIFVATQYGVFESIDHGNSWMQINSGLSNLNINCITLNQSQYLFLGTVGSWVFKSVDPTISIPSTPALLSPSDNSVNAPINIEFAWSKSNKASTSELVLSLDSSFSSTILDTVLVEDSLKVFGLTNSTKYYWEVRSKNVAGTSNWANPWNFVTKQVDGVKNELFATLQSFKLLQNYPNPFNPTTTIEYTVPKASLVIIKVYDILGDEVATLVNENQTAGRYSVIFNSQQTTSNRQLTSGVYFSRMQAGGFVDMKKLILLK